MAPTASYLILFSSLITLLSIATAQDKAPHDIANKNPMAFSPSACEFFHPKTQEPDARNPGASASPLPITAQLETAKSLDSKASAKLRRGGDQMGAGAITGIVLGLAFAVLLAIGVYHVLITRRANVNRAKPVQPN